MKRTLLSMKQKKVLGNVGLWILTILVTFIILFPVFWIFTSSITPVDNLFETPVRYFPEQPTLDNYKALFETMDVGGMTITTLIIAGLSIVFTIVVSLFAAYAFARIKFRGKGLIYSLLVFSAMLPVIVTLIPMSSMMIQLGVNDTPQGLAFLYTSSFIPFTTMIFTNFISDVPISLEEAAEVDGAGLFRKMFRILLPLLRPIIATMAIIIFIWSLNEFIIPLVFAGNKTVPLSLGLARVPRVSEYSLPWEKISALATIILIPIAFFVTAFQKHIMEGLMAGGVKQ